jgi:putative transposase
MIEGIRQGPKEDGFEAPLTKLCRWFGVARRSLYYKPSRATLKKNAFLAALYPR